MVTRNLSLFEQVRLQILQWIRSGFINPDDGALPSETEIADLLNTSRATVREALSQLERDRVIIRRQGSGTYINPTIRHLTSTLNELLDPRVILESQGYKAKIRLMEYRQTTLGKEAAIALNTSADTAAVHTSVLYLADTAPAILMDAAWPLDELGPSTNPQPEYISLSQYSSLLTGTIATHSVATLEAANASERLSQYLNTAQGTALRCLVEIHLTDFGRPVFFSRSWFAPQVIKLQMLRNTYESSNRVSVW